MTADLLEVWGDPIGHSLSPVLHGAAYDALGNGWTYARRRVTEADFAAELAGLDERYRGLSLTMPLKGAAFRAADTTDRRAALTGAVNTLALLGGERVGFNTDVGGLVRALADEEVARVRTARIVGAGATAASALVALAELGAESVEVAARRPEAVAPLQELGHRLATRVTGVPLALGEFVEVDVTIATLPGDVRLAETTVDALARRGGLLVDAVYGTWPTALATGWLRAGHRSVPGLGMLLHQALLQVRVFTSGDVDLPLPDEPAVLLAMRTALL